LLSDTYSAPHLINPKLRGYQLGIVTDCSAETPLSWTSTWLKEVVDVVAFSCELGVRKPNPEMYLSATRRLNVQPEECLFFFIRGFVRDSYTYTIFEGTSEIQRLISSRAISGVHIR
jgi:hypothetical protein